MPDVEFAGFYDIDADARGDTCQRELGASASPSLDALLDAWTR